MKTFSDSWESEVRDYEVDYQGIVNNANYFHYLEHARSLLLKKLGFSVTELAERHINLVLLETEIFFKKSLKYGDTFFIETDFSRMSRFKFVFHQKIFLKDETLCTKAKSVTAAITPSGVPVFLDELKDF